MRVAILWVMFISVIKPSLISAVTAQESGSPASQNSVTLSKLAPPNYPPLARQARIMGAVNLRVSVRPDGSIASTSVLSGHPVLEQAAIDSVKGSQFECRGCTSDATLSLEYDFVLPPEGIPNADPCCCSHASTLEKAPDPEIRRFSDHVLVTTTAGHVCMCPDQCTIKWAEEHSRFRSLKCLYLWKCGNRHIAVE